MWTIVNYDCSFICLVCIDTTVGGHGLLIPECTLDLVVHASELTILNFNSPLIIFEIIQEPKHKLPAMLTLDVYSYNSDSSNQKKKKSKDDKVLVLLIKTKVSNVPNSLSVIFFRYSFHLLTYLHIFYFHWIAVSCHLLSRFITWNTCIIFQLSRL